MRATQSSGFNLCDKYRPRKLAEIVGQPWAVEVLASFADAARSDSAQRGAFVFHGPSGVGKTCSAWALAEALGCDMDDPDLGGVVEIPSGLQDGSAVEQLLRSLSLRPLFGSGWKVAIINEADQMTRQAEAIWLDGLENLPPRTVVVFTTNDVARLSARFLGRVEVVAFSGTSDELRAGLELAIKRIWKAETGRALRRLPDGLGRVELADSNLSVRLAIQQIAPYLRTARPLPAAFAAPIVRDPDAGSEAARKAWETRRRRAASATG